MHKLINWKVNSEYRRKIRKSHAEKGSSENEFYCFIDIFRSTLVEFDIAEDDITLIMSKIRDFKEMISTEN